MPRLYGPYAFIQIFAQVFLSGAAQKSYHSMIKRKQMGLNGNKNELN